MIIHSTAILLGLLESFLISVVSGTLCTTNADCTHRFHLASNEEAYCRLTFLSIGCCYVRRKSTHWTQWSSWSHCDVTCGSGTRISTRMCKSSGSCVGSSIRSETCGSTHHPCTTDRYYDDWSAWTTCSQTCDWGTKTRSRSCIHPYNSGSHCTGTKHEVRPCQDHPCPVNGWFGEWSAWSSCSVTCGDGHMTKTRVCHPPLYGGLPCPNRLTHSKTCNPRPCAVDGILRDWGPWGHCSATCEGFRKRTRSCIPPTNGGAPCTGNTVETVQCGAQHCPVDGVLRDWGSWSHCSATCEGNRKRTRSCIPPTNGGAQCSGNTMEAERCGAQHCPVDGILRDWGPWGHCSATCEGFRKRTRSCIPPTNGGAPCTGNTAETVQCGAQHCPVDGVLRAWGSWSHCSATCEGNRKRTRSCIPPTNGGAQCSGNTREAQRCGAQHCPVDGMLSVWGNWTPCSVTCGSGSRVRSRACIPPQYGGRDCHGLTYEMNRCSVTPCPTQPTSTTQPSTTPSGVSCPTCNDHMACTWNTVCDVTESCMVRSFPGFQFTTHCALKDDCVLLKMLAKSHGEIFCCENEACLRTTLGM